jgi:hypothetical protein
MTASEFRFGFRIVGKTCEPRRLVDAGAAFAAYAACDQRAECGREAYLSAFRFCADFADHLKTTGSTAGFAGPCWSPWVWWDLDSEELQYAHADAAGLAAFLVERYGIDAGELLIFFSGSKGFHLGLSTALWLPAPSPDFAKTARRFAEHVAELAAVTIDTGVYDRVRAFRAPNSKHPKTGLHKRRLSYDELAGPLDAILELAKTPAPFAVPTPTRTSETAAADWQAAAALVASEGEAKTARRAAGGNYSGRSPTPSLNRSTLAFMREGTGTGDRHRLLFSAAANLAEFGCTPALAHVLLTEAGLDSGLPPREVHRQIECGLAAVPSPSLPAPTQQAGTASAQAALDGSTVKEPPEAAASDSGGRGVEPPAADVQAALARLWQSTPTPTPPTPKADQGQPGGAVASPIDGTPPRCEWPGILDAAQLPKCDCSPDPVGWIRATPTGDGRLRVVCAKCGRPLGYAPERLTKTLPPDPPPLLPLPPGAVGSGTLDKPCRCGSTEYVELPIGEGRTRRDCRKCGRFVGFGRWYDQGGPTP